MANDVQAPLAKAPGSSRAAGKPERTPLIAPWSGATKLRPAGSSSVEVLTAALPASGGSTHVLQYHEAAGNHPGTPAALAGGRVRRGFELGGGQAKIAERPWHGAAGVVANQQDRRETARVLHNYARRIVLAEQRNGPINRLAR